MCEVIKGISISKGLFFSFFTSIFLWLFLFVCFQVLSYPSSAFFDSTFTFLNGLPLYNFVHPFLSSSISVNVLTIALPHSNEFRLFGFGRSLRQWNFFRLLYIKICVHSTDWIAFVIIFVFPRNDHTQALTKFENWAYFLE